MDSPKADPEIRICRQAVYLEGKGAQGGSQKMTQRREGKSVKAVLMGKLSLAAVGANSPVNLQ